MSIYKELQADYKDVAEGYREAKNKGDRKLMIEYSRQLVHIADTMEKFVDD